MWTEGSQGIQRPLRCHGRLPPGASRHAGAGPGAGRRGTGHRLDLRVARLRGGDQRRAAGVVHGRLRDLGARRRPWDLKAKRLGLPLYRLLGVRRDNVPVYCSGGFTCYDDDQLRDQLSGWASGQRISRRSGSWTPPLAWTCAGSKSPVSSDDLDGLREVRAAVPADVTAGEYGWGPVLLPPNARGRGGGLLAGRRVAVRRHHRVAAGRGAPHPTAWRSSGTACSSPYAGNKKLAKYF